MIYIGSYESLESPRILTLFVIVDTIIIITIIISLHDSLAFRVAHLFSGETCAYTRTRQRSKYFQVDSPLEPITLTTPRHCKLRQLTKTYSNINVAWR
jgi:hypothetical protein